MSLQSNRPPVEMFIVSCAGAGTQVPINKDGATEMQLRTALAVAGTCAGTELDCGDHCTLNKFLLANREIIDRLLQNA